MYVLTFKSVVNKPFDEKVTIAQRDRSSSLSSITDNSPERIVKSPIVKSKKDVSAQLEEEKIPQSAAKLDRCDFYDSMAINEFTKFMYNTTRGETDILWIAPTVEVKDPSKTHSRFTRSNSKIKKDD